MPTRAPPSLLVSMMSKTLGCCNICLTASSTLRGGDEGGERESKGNHFFQHATSTQIEEVIPLKRPRRANWINIKFRTTPRRFNGRRLLLILSSTTTTTERTNYSNMHARNTIYSILFDALYDPNRSTPISTIANRPRWSSSVRVTPLTCLRSPPTNHIKTKQKRKEQTSLQTKKSTGGGFN